MANQLRLRSVFHIQQRQAAVAPAAVCGIAGDNRVVQRIALTFRPVWLLAFGLVHARQPPAPSHFWPAGIGKIDGQENVIGKSVDQRRHVSPAPAHIPDAVNADAVQRQKTDLARCVRG
jgi:hypothetical protein